MSMRSHNVLLKIAYDGTNFCGWQRQPGVRTVCGELEEILSGVCGTQVKLDGTSRTDAGVHACGQQASFKAEFEIPVERLAKAVNDRLAKDRLERAGEIRIVWAKEVPEDFHARFSSKGKRYIYRINDAEEPDIFRRNYCYLVNGKKLDAGAMNEACAYIRGVHDFKSFEAAGSTPRESTVREIYRLDVARDGDDVTMTVEGNGFLYNMVRIIAGTLVEVGLGARSPESLAGTIEAKDRAKAGHTAPACGLYLDEVFY